MFRSEQACTHACVLASLLGLHLPTNANLLLERGGPVSHSLVFEDEHCVGIKAPLGSYILCLSHAFSLLLSVCNACTMKLKLMRGEKARIIMLDMLHYTSKLKLYRDGIKSKEDKIGMPCRHSTVTHVIPSPRKLTTQALYCRRGTQLREWCTCR